METKLITKEAQEAQKAARQAGKSKDFKIPVVTYLIDQLQMFTFQGTPLLLVAFENKTVRMFESDNGHFQQEFLFYDSQENKNLTEE